MPGNTDDNAHNHTTVNQLPITNHAETLARCSATNTTVARPLNSLTLYHRLRLACTLQAGGSAPPPMMRDAPLPSVSVERWAALMPELRRVRTVNYQWTRATSRSPSESDQARRASPRRDLQARHDRQQGVPEARWPSQMADRCYRSSCGRNSRRYMFTGCQHRGAMLNNRAYYLHNVLLSSEAHFISFGNVSYSLNILNAFCAAVAVTSMHVCHNKTNCWAVGSMKIRQMPNNLRMIILHLAIFPLIMTSRYIVWQLACFIRENTSLNYFKLLTRFPACAWSAWLY